jgi:hypothetical protein
VHVGAPDGRAATEGRCGGPLAMVEASTRMKRMPTGFGTELLLRDRAARR